MNTVSLLAFLGLVALGSYIQTVSGFAIALIITGAWLKTFAALGGCSNVFGSLRDR